MKQILARGEIRLTKSLGQNFLHDGNQLRRIVRAAELRPEDRVLEIGPGLGPLTELLLTTDCAVLAIEKDRRLFEFLKTRFPEDGSLDLVHTDALEWLTQRGDFDWSGWKLVANLPYSVASPILVELAQGATCPARLVVTLQEEVARRLTATAGTADYGVLTLLVRLRYEAIGFFKIPATCFFPAPEAGSACVTLTRGATPLLATELIPAFTRIVKRGFSQRRKMMGKLLKADWPTARLEAAFRRLGLSPQTRAESVSVKQFAELTRSLVCTEENLQPPSPPMLEEIFDVVNERDEVVGRAPRGEVHRRGLKHRAVHVLVFNARGELFLQKRSVKKDNHPGRWDSSASGHVDHGETYDACAVRELKEELGLELAAPPTRLFKIDACAETGQEFVWVYRVEAEGPFALHPVEIERGDWFTPARITEWLRRRPDDFAGAVPVIWERLGVSPA